MKYTYKNKEYKLADFLRDNGSNFILFWTEGMDEDNVHIIKSELETLKKLYVSYNKQSSFIGNITSNSFMSLKEFFIPYKKQPEPQYIPEHLYKLYYFIDFVRFSYKDFNLIIEREENGFKDKVAFQSQQDCLAKTGLNYLTSHIIIRSQSNRGIFEPLYDVKGKKFYYQGAKMISPINIFED